MPCRSPPPCWWRPLPWRRMLPRSRSISSAAGSRNSRPSPSPPCPSPGGTPSTLGREIAEVIASDLRSTGLFTPLGPNGVGTYTLGQASSPAYGEWRNAGAAQLVTGTVEPREDGRITVGCYVHDVAAGRELARQGFAVATSDWRRAAHKCADTDLFAPVRATGLPRHAHRLCRRNRPQERAPQAHRDHGFGRLEPSLPDHRASDGRHPALQPARRQIGLYELSGPPPARARHGRRDGRRSPARPGHRLHLRAALFARRARDRLFDGQRRQ